MTTMARADALAALDDYHPLLLPAAERFSDVLEYLGEWSARELEPPARFIPCEAPAASARERSAWRGSGRNMIGPYTTVDLSQLGRGHPRHRAIACRATDAVIDAVAGRIVTPDDSLTFRVIGHRHTGLALVILEHGYIIGSHWLAYIDPRTIPAPGGGEDRLAPPPVDDGAPSDRQAQA